MKTTKLPKEIFEQLNPEQKKAVVQTEGPVLVLAGPGTGKTQIVAARIIRILEKTDTQPESILALTFTEAGVRALRLRLLELIGSRAYRVGIYTFHGFCSEVIRSNPENFIIATDQKPLTDLERFSLLEEILDQNTFRLLRPINAPTYYLRAILEAIQNLKREGILPPDLKLLAETEREALVDLQEKQKAGEKVAKTKLAELTKNDEKLTDLVEIYYLYQKAVLDKGRFDFEDMINFVVREFGRNENLLLSYQERFQYFLVDEFQDSNSSQLQLIKQLTSFWDEQANLFVVGDPNQSIYRFQGASFENTLAFLSDYPTAKVVTLKDNYRSTQTILDAAGELIGNNPEAELKGLDTHARLTAKAKQKETPLKVAKFSNGLVEQFHIVKTIKKLLDRGVEPGQIAVIYKRNQTAGELVPILNHFGIPYQIAGGGNLLNDPQLTLFIRLVKLVTLIRDHEEDGPLLFEFLTLPFIDLNPVDVLKLNRFAAGQHLGLIDFLGQKKYSKLDLLDPHKIDRVFDKLAQWVALSGQLTPLEFVQQLSFKSGFLAHLEKQIDAYENLSHLKGFLEFVGGLEQSNPQLTLGVLVDQLETLMLNNLNIEEQDLGLLPGLVTLTTAHKTKGLEWDYCFIYKLADGEWGNLPTRDLIKLPEGILKFSGRTKDRLRENEDERRLFYVALTRARCEVFLSYSQTYPGAGRKETIPSLFLAELPVKLLSEVETKDTVKAAVGALTSLMSPSVAKVMKPEQEYLRSLVTDLHLSATALTTYQQCAYKFKLKYLIKIPEAQSPILIYGSAVHRSLELFYRKFKQTGQAPELPELLTIYNSVLERVSLAPQEKAHRRRQGEQILTAYYSQHEGEFDQPLFVERWFGGQHQPIFHKNIPLVGKVDRIDLIERNLVRIVDYKTGRPKSLNQILGLTADSDGSQLTQLMFYKLITDLDESFKFQVKELVLDFVEGPHQSKTFKRPQVSIDDTQIEQLKKTIEDVYEGIKKLEFVRTTDYKVCETCPFKHHCWPNGIPKLNPQQLTFLDTKE